MVESSLPEEILLAWKRTTVQEQVGEVGEQQSRLKSLMSFLSREVSIKREIDLAKTGFGSSCASNIKPKQKNNPIPALAGMHVGEEEGCIFCEKSHRSSCCFKGHKLGAEKTFKIAQDRKVCLKCLVPGHRQKNCGRPPTCKKCGGGHYAIICRTNGERKAPATKSATDEEENNHSPRDCGEGWRQPSDKVYDGPSTWREPQQDWRKQPTSGTGQVLAGSASHVCSSTVMLHTLMVEVSSGRNRKTVRAFIDPGAQRSYLLKTTAHQLGAVPIGKEEVTHTLFGGTQTGKTVQNVLEVTLSNVGNGFKITTQVRDQDRICGGIPRIRGTSDLFQELKRHHIFVTDVGEDCPPIELLLGADIFGRLLTGEVVNLDSGLTALETKLGWTLSGERRTTPNYHSSVTLMSMHTLQQSITSLWELDAIGIRDPVEVKAEEEAAKEARTALLKSVTRKRDGRYEVSLPWKVGHPELPSKRNVAEKRLQSAFNKLRKQGMVQEYNNIFREWETEGFIERVPRCNSMNPSRILHYVPHRPVLKISSQTTPVRPVFDASCKIGTKPSLNKCLEKGPNYVQLIPDVLLKFREKPIGFVSDIRKAFQMIGIREQDRDATRFLWYEKGNADSLVEFRHTRVMFGATCSPFILGAVLEQHLVNEMERGKEPEVAKKLLESFYVDNCVASCDTLKEYEEFRIKSTHILQQAQMELRMWMKSGEEDKATEVLGLKWERAQDVLSVTCPSVESSIKPTRRNVLSVVHQIFDPLGFVAPALLPMKLVIRRSCIRKDGWDDEIEEKLQEDFRAWT